MNHSSPDWEPQIKRLHSLGREMCELAQTGEWEAVIEREEQRRVLLGELFQDPLPAQWVSLLRDAVQATLASDAQVQELACAELDKLSDGLRTLKQGRRALQAYQGL
ncbi:MAG: flagellar protein FliT [Gammaproteobacteria bacterium]|nr:flagellar protein FliT [Gammaproteobacteria bacterium]